MKNAQGQFRVMKNALESRSNQRVEGDHQAVPWIGDARGDGDRRGRKHDEVFTPRRRWKEKEFTTPAQSDPQQRKGLAN